MTKFSKDTINRWALLAADHVGQNGYDLHDVETGAHAWTIAHKVGIVNEAYEDRSVVDAHIKTALQHIFPDAVFKDTYTY